MSFPYENVRKIICNLLSVSFVAFFPTASYVICYPKNAFQSGTGIMKCVGNHILIYWRYFGSSW